MNSIFIFIIIAGLIFVAATIILGKLQKRLLKYIPAVLAAVAAIVFSIKAYFYSEGFEALGYFVMMLISAAVFIASIIASIVMEVLSRRK